MANETTTVNLENPAKHSKFSKYSSHCSGQPDVQVDPVYHAVPGQEQPAGTVQRSKRKTLYRSGSPGDQHPGERDLHDSEERYLFPDRRAALPV